MEKLIEKIKQWGMDRGIDKCGSLNQSTKTLEEIIELQQALINEDKEEFKDAIGDIFVTLIMLCIQNDLDIEDCIEKAYNEIKDRKGKVIDGLFVKDDEIWKL